MLLGFNPIRSVFPTFDASRIILILRTVGATVSNLGTPLIEEAATTAAARPPVSGVELVHMTTAITDALAPLLLALQLDTFVQAFSTALEGHLEGVSTDDVKAWGANVLNACCAILANPNVLLDAHTKSAYVCVMCCCCLKAVECGRWVDVMTPCTVVVCSHAVVSLLNAQFPRVEGACPPEQRVPLAVFVARDLLASPVPPTLVGETSVLSLPPFGVTPEAPRMAQLALCRAVMMCVDKATLLTPLGGAGAGAGAGADTPTTEGVPALMPGFLFDAIVSACGVPDTPSRLYAFQALECWLQTCRSVAKVGGRALCVRMRARVCVRPRTRVCVCFCRWLSTSCGRDVSDIECCDGQSLSVVLLTTAISHQVVELCLTNWEHPSRKISGFMQVLFAKFMDTEDDTITAQTTLSEAKGTQAKETVLAERHSLLKRLLDQPEGSHSKCVAQWKALRVGDPSARLSPVLIMWLV